MPSFAEQAAAWQRAEADAARSGNTTARADAELARLALARHPAAEHARRTHARQTTGSRDGVQK